MYHIYKVIFQDDEGKRKNIKVEASGIIPAIQEAVAEAMRLNCCIAWNVVKAEDMTK